MEISRRDFLKRIGAGAAVAAGVAACGKTEDSVTSGNTNSPVRETKKEDMTYRVNPKTGDRVSILGYGCMRWPTDENDNIDQEQVNRLVDYAIEHGVNYFDTAPVYCKGLSERATGIALSRHPRESYFIATKFSNQAPGRWSREASLEMYHNSFKELQVDYIDYMLLHCIGMGGMEAYNKRFVENGMLEFLLKEREAGRIRNLGFSYHGDIEVFDYLLSRHDEYKWDFVQIQMNYVDWKHAKATNPRNVDAEYLYNELEKRGIPVVIMEPLLGGRLAKVHDHIARQFKEREPGMSVASWAFRFAGTYGGVMNVLSGMTYMEHLKDNLQTYAPLKPLTESDLEFLERVATEMVSYKTVPCNDCKYCMPCPYGIDIPANLLHYNKMINLGRMPVPTEGDNAEDREEYYMRRRNYIIDFDRSVPRERQARYCVGCNQCVFSCPQRIDIPGELRRIDEFVEGMKQEVKV